MALKPRQRAFLDAYRHMGVVVDAAKSAGCGRDTHYGWLENSPEYRAAFEACKEEATERLEREVRRRAEEGELEVVMYAGEPVLQPLMDADGNYLRDPETGRIRYSDRPMMMRRKSDILAMFLLKAARPQVYRDNAPAVLQQINIEQRRADPDLARLSLEQLRLLRSIAEAAQGPVVDVEPAAPARRPKRRLLELGQIAD